MTLQDLLARIEIALAGLDVGGGVAVADVTVIDRLHSKYRDDLVADLRRLVDGIKADTEQGIELATAFLAKQWLLIQGTALDYTVLHDQDAHNILFQIAEALADLYNQSIEDPLQHQYPIQFLMPGIEIDVLDERFPSFIPVELIEWTSEDQRHFDRLQRLKATERIKPAELGQFNVLLEKKVGYERQQAQLHYYHVDGHFLKPARPLVALLSTHILSQDRKALIPVGVLCEPAVVVYRPYADEDEYPLIDSKERKRLYTLNDHTMNLEDLQLQLKKIQSDQSHLWGVLTDFCDVLRGADAHTGIGQQKAVGLHAYPALRKLKIFYDQLVDEQKAKIPASLREEIEHTLSLAFDHAYNKQHAAEVATGCFGIRKENLQRMMQGNEALLSGISPLASHQQQRVTELKANIASLQKTIQTLVATVNFHGRDHLPMPKALFDRFGVDPAVKNHAELDRLMRCLAPDMLFEMLSIPVNKTEVVGFFRSAGGFDGNYFCDFLLGHPLSQLEAFFKAVGPELLEIIPWRRLPALKQSMPVDKFYGFMRVQLQRCMLLKQWKMVDRILEHAPILVNEVQMPDRSSLEFVLETGNVWQAKSLLEKGVAKVNQQAVKSSVLICLQRLGDCKDEKKPELDELFSLLFKQGLIESDPLDVEWLEKCLETGYVHLHETWLNLDDVLPPGVWNKVLLQFFERMGDGSVIAGAANVGAISADAAAWVATAIDADAEDLHYVDANGQHLLHAVTSWKLLQSIVQTDLFKIGGALEGCKPIALKVLSDDIRCSNDKLDIAVCLAKQGYRVDFGDALERFFENHKGWASRCFVKLCNDLPVDRLHSGLLYSWWRYSHSIQFFIKDVSEVESAKKIVRILGFLRSDIEVSAKSTVIEYMYHAFVKRIAPDHIRLWSRALFFKGYGQADWGLDEYANATRLAKMLSPEDLLAWIVNASDRMFERQFRCVELVFRRCLLTKQELEQGYPALITLLKSIDAGKQEVILQTFRSACWEKILLHQIRHSASFFYLLPQDARRGRDEVRLMGWIARHYQQRQHTMTASVALFTGRNAGAALLGRCESVDQQLHLLVDRARALRYPKQLRASGKVIMLIQEVVMGSGYCSQRGELTTLAFHLLQHHYCQIIMPHLRELRIHDVHRMPAGCLPVVFPERDYRTTWIAEDDGGYIDRVSPYGPECEHGDTYFVDPYNGGGGGGGGGAKY